MPQFQDMQKVSQGNGWNPLSAMENHYNLLYREDKKDPIPLCKKTNVSLMPYSPLAVDLLGRTVWTADTLRNATDKVSRGKYDRAEDNDLAIIDRVQKVAELHGHTYGPGSHSPAAGQRRCFTDHWRPPKPGISTMRRLR